MLIVTSQCCDGYYQARVHSSIYLRVHAKSISVDAITTIGALVNTVAINVISQKSNHWIINYHNCPCKNLCTEPAAKHFPDVVNFH